MPRGRMKSTPSIKNRWETVQPKQRNPIGRAAASGRLQTETKKYQDAAATVKEHGILSGKGAPSKPKAKKAHRNPRGKK